MGSSKMEVLFEQRKFVVEEDAPGVGFYLYVYEGEDCVFDSLQDTRELAIETAFEKYGCPKSLWS